MKKHDAYKAARRQENRKRPVPSNIPETQRKALEQDRTLFYYMLRMDAK